MTTSPASSITLDQAELEDMPEYVEKLWEVILCPAFMCPAEVVFAIVQINHLRANAPRVPAPRG